MSLDPVHFSSKSDLWETPQDFFDRLDAEFHFATDVCALPTNAKCERFSLRRSSCSDRHKPRTIRHENAQGGGEGCHVAG